MKETVYIKVTSAVQPDRTDLIVDRVKRYGTAAESGLKVEVNKRWWIGGLDKVTVSLKKELSSLGAAQERTLFIQGISGFTEEEVCSIEIHKWPEEEV
jgi:hypothetical protein